MQTPFFPIIAKQVWPPNGPYIALTQPLTSNVSDTAKGPLYLTKIPTTLPKNWNVGKWWTKSAVDFTTTSTCISKLFSTFCILHFNRIPITLVMGITEMEGRGRYRIDSDPFTYPVLQVEEVRIVFSFISLCIWDELTWIPNEQRRKSIPYLIKFSLKVHKGMSIIWRQLTTM